MKSDQPMPPAYFETHFRQEAPGSEWPAEFAVITAYATTGEQWAVEENEAADRQLEAELRKTSRWLERLTGYSPTTGHAEPGWAVDLPLDAASEVGCRYHQDAIYFVIGDALSVTFCDPRRKRLVPVGIFRERVSHPHS